MKEKGKKPKEGKKLEVKKEVGEGLKPNVLYSIEGMSFEEALKNIVKKGKG